MKTPLILFAHDFNGKIYEEQYTTIRLDSPRFRVSVPVRPVLQPKRKSDSEVYLPPAIIMHREPLRMVEGGRGFNSLVLTDDIARADTNGLYDAAQLRDMFVRWWWYKRDKLLAGLPVLTILTLKYTHPEEAAALRP